jgi:dihydroorotase
VKIHIQGGRLIDPRHGIDRVDDVFVAAGKVVALGAAPADFHANRVLDAAGLVVCPGLVDVAVRLREPGYEYLATLESEMRAAAAGGVTSLACPPDTDPPLDEPGLVEMLKFRARNLPGPRVYPLGALTRGLDGTALSEMAELFDAGCVAFSQGDRALFRHDILLRALEYADTFGHGVWLRPEDAALARDGVAHEGAVASRLGLPGIPELAESIAVATLILMARQTGAHIHLERLSCASAVDMVRAAKAEGLRITCDVAAHQLHLTDMDLLGFDSLFHLRPPLRTQRDRDAIRAALRDGAIDAVCSDHTPVNEDAKQLPFGESEPGASGVELLLPLTLRWAREAGVGLSQALAALTTRPAELLGIPGGHLAVGAPADVCVFDPEASWLVSAPALKSQGKNSPFLGQEMQGRVRYTVIDGHVDHESG